MAPPILIVGFCEFLEFLKVISYNLTRVKYLNLPGRQLCFHVLYILLTQTFILSFTGLYFTCLRSSNTKNQ